MMTETKFTLLQLIISLNTLKSSKARQQVKGKKP